VDRAAYEQFGRELFPALDAHSAFRTEFRLRRRNGEVSPSEHTVTQTFDAQGRCTHLISLVRDATERRRAGDRTRLQCDLALAIGATTNVPEALA
jgi:PAS domain S-box-containing protein